MRIPGVARLFVLVPALLLCLPGVGRGQEWIEYVSRDDLFTVNFPAQPTVSTIDWTTEYGLTIPGHVHHYDRADSHYLVTVVDYSNVQKIHDRPQVMTVRHVVV